MPVSKGGTFLLMNTPKFVIVDDDNYRLSDPCETEKEARAQASFNNNFMPEVTHVCRVCPSCGEHDLNYCSTFAYGLEACFWYCTDCDWAGDPE